MNFPSDSPRRTQGFEARVGQYFCEIRVRHSVCEVRVRCRLRPIVLVKLNVQRLSRIRGQTQHCKSLEHVTRLKLKHKYVIPIRQMFIDGHKCSLSKH